MSTSGSEVGADDLAAGKIMEGELSGPMSDRAIAQIQIHGAFLFENRLLGSGLTQRVSTSTNHGVQPCLRSSSSLEVYKQGAESDLLTSIVDFSSPAPICLRPDIFVFPVIPFSHPETPYFHSRCFKHLDALFPTRLDSQAVVAWQSFEAQINITFQTHVRTGRSGIGKKQLQLRSSLL